MGVNDRSRCHVLPFRSNGGQSRIECLDHLIDVPFLNDVGRQKAQHRLMGSVDQNVVLQQNGNHCLGRVGGIQFHAQHQAHPTNLANAAVLGLQPFELRAEIATNFAHMIQQLIQFAQKLDRDRAGQRPSTERRAVHARVHAAGHTIRRENRSQRQSCRERLRDRHDVGLYAVVLVGEVVSGPPQATLDLIENQQSATALRQLSRQSARTPG